MTDFNDRARAFELLYAHDQEIFFRANARRDRLFGEWAAERLKLSPEDSVKYARAMIMMMVSKPDDSRLIAKVAKDFDENNIDMSDHQIELKLAYFKDQAIRQLMEDPLS
jgi:hypothetical protein